MSLTYDTTRDSLSQRGYRKVKCVKLTAISTQPWDCESVVQAATDVLRVSRDAIETEVTSEVEETLLATQHTYRDRGSILQ